MMKNKFLILLMFTCLIMQGDFLFGQRDNVIPIPPPPPSPPKVQMKLSKSDLSFLETLKENSNRSKKVLLSDLDTLSKIVLNEKVFFLLRLEAIELISQSPIEEAKIFLFNHIDTYIYDEIYSDRGHFMYNIPCYDAFLTINGFNLYHYLFNADYFDDCYNQNKLKLLSKLIKKEFGRINSIKLIEGHLSKSKSKCSKSSLSFIIKELGKY